MDYQAKFKEFTIPQVYEKLEGIQTIPEFMYKITQEYHDLIMLKQDDVEIKYSQLMYDVMSQSLNLKENNIEANIINEDFTLWNNDTKFDVVVSNPPYFDSKTIKQRNENKFIELARHEGTLNLSSLCENIAKHLSINGRAYLVYRPIRLKDLEKSLNENNLYIKEYQLVYDTRKKEAKSVLVEITFNKCEKVQLEDQYI